jgi:hypothetical protein
VAAHAVYACTTALQVPCLYSSCSVLVTLCGEFEGLVKLVMGKSLCPLQNTVGLRLAAKHQSGFLLGLDVQCTHISRRDEILH